MEAEHPAPIAPLQRYRPADGTSRYDMTVQQGHDSLAKSLGTMTVTQTTSSCGANEVVMRVIVYDYGSAGRVVDTTLSVAATLAPILERTRKTSGDFVLDFSAGLVRGSMPEYGGYRPDSVNVVQLDPAKSPHSEGTWVVHSRDRRLESTYRIGERSRRLLAIDVHAESARYRITLCEATAKEKRMWRVGSTRSRLPEHAEVSE
ncbi:MAG: hypothetical protein H0U66_13470 [Gemmatimonadaceae bacterium]|nr:hypothetical protein [Gemmatimonadaceae bacterium]